MKAPSLPQSPEQLCKTLLDIFPRFKEALDRNENEDNSSPLTYQSVMMDFTYFFGKEQDSFSEKQLCQFASLVNTAVMKSGPLENAFATCFLEHLHQIKVTKLLNPHLSKLARSKSHA